MNAESMAAFNQGTYRRMDVVREYASWQWIENGEMSLLHRVRKEIHAGEVLDLGVGGGRLVPVLRQAAKGYTGLDYSPEMIAVCRAKFPGTAFLCADARDLRRFPVRCFHLVVFSFNGIDYMSRQDRLYVLGEIQRVLVSGGYLLFSSHNITSSLYARQYGQLYDTGDDAIVHENLRDSSYFCYYTGKREVGRQLRTAGFSGEILCCNRDGGNPASDLRSGWLHYLAKK